MWFISKYNCSMLTFRPSICKFRCLKNESNFHMNNFVSVEAIKSEMLEDVEKVMSGDFDSSNLESPESKISK